MDDSSWRFKGTCIFKDDLSIHNFMRFSRGVLGDSKNIESFKKISIEGKIMSMKSLKKEIQKFHTSKKVINNLSIRNVGFREKKIQGNLPATVMPRYWDCFLIDL